VAPVLYGKIFAVLVQIGLVLLLFLIGLEFDFEHLKTHAAAAAGVMAAGIVLPMLLGYAIATHVYNAVTGSESINAPSAFALFLATALMITALPTLGRILIEMGLARTRLAAIVITAAAAGDAVGWILLAAVAALAKGTDDGLSTGAMVGLTLAFALALQFVVRPLALLYFRRSLARHDGQLTLTSLTVLLVTLLACALATSRIGVFAVFGAFLFGAVLSDERALRDAVTTRLRDFVTAFFLPIIFTATGLRTDFQLLTEPALLKATGLIVAAGLFGKIAGAGLAARLSGFKRKEAIIIGVMMNTRALMLLVVVNAGLDLGIIPKSLFTAMVLLAVLTTVMCAPLVKWISRGTELEAALRPPSERQTG
jgi:Kef-type K+ transport system membrane component KefB